MPHYFLQSKFKVALSHNGGNITISHQIEFQKIMLFPKNMTYFDTEAQCVEAVKVSRWPAGTLPALRLDRPLCRRSRGPQAVSVQRPPLASLADFGQIDGAHRVAADDFVLGDLPHQPGHDRIVDALAQTEEWLEIRLCLDVASEWKRRHGPIGQPPSTRGAVQFDGSYLCGVHAGGKPGRNAGSFPSPTNLKKR